jgi:hypothetical protein
VSEPVKLEAKKLGGLVQVPREVMLDLGLVEPTPEERREADRVEAEAEARRDEAARKAARKALAEITEQPARAVLDLHKSVDGYCDGCEFGGYEAEAPWWPCDTVDVIAKHYGIDPTDLL